MSNFPSNARCNHKQFSHSRLFQLFFILKNPNCPSVDWMMREFGYSFELYNMVQFYYTNIMMRKNHITHIKQAITSICLRWYVCVAVCWCKSFSQNEKPNCVWRKKTTEFVNHFPLFAFRCWSACSSTIVDACVVRDLTNMLNAPIVIAPTPTQTPVPASCYVYFIKHVKC